MAASDQKAIATCGIIAVGVGSANAILKHHRPPSSRFLIGSGVAFLMLSALSEGEPEVAKGLAIGVMTTVLLGEGGGVLSYINDHGEIDTKAPKPEAPAPPPPRPVRVVHHPVAGAHRQDQTPPFPGLPALPLLSSRFIPYHPH